MRLIVLSLAACLSLVTVATTNADAPIATDQQVSHVSFSELVQLVNASRGDAGQMQGVPGVVSARPNMCCKICTIGKACGDTCISKEKECHVGPGCACDG